MAVLNKEFIGFDKKIVLTPTRKEDLQGSVKAINQTLRDWFKEKKEGELQPKFHSQGSLRMGTANNPIPEENDEGKKLLKYDLDNGIYFIEIEGEYNEQKAATWHDWVYKAVENHTNQKPISKNTCVRVIFADGHHVDLPIYYKDGEDLYLVHKSKGLIKSDPKAFYKWFNEKKKGTKLEKIVRLLKAWKNYKQNSYSHLKLPSGFELTILATNNYVSEAKLDDSFRETVRAIRNSLDSKFECLRPTTPENEDVFEDYSPTRKSNFMNALNSLVKDLDKADNEKNGKKASEILINNQFGDRFPKGLDKDDKDKSNDLHKSLSSSLITPKPYAE